jgi:hypothetical protein
MLSSPLKKQINFPELKQSSEPTHSCKHYLNVAVKVKEVEFHPPASLCIAVCLSCTPDNIHQLYIAYLDSLYYRPGN